MTWWLLLEMVIGHLALLATGVCLHRCFALSKARGPSRATRLSGYAGTALVVATSALGWIIYPPYRELVKLDLYAHARPVGVLFEVKEHLAWYALALAVAGGVCMALSGGEAGPRLRPAIRASYTAAAVLLLACGVMGVYIASVNGFDDMLP